MNTKQALRINEKEILMRNSTPRTLTTKSLMNVSIFGAALLLGASPVHAGTQSTSEKDSKKLNGAHAHEQYVEAKVEPLAE